MGVKKVWDCNKIIIIFDHITPASTEIAATLQAKIRTWSNEQGLSNFFDIGEGVCHQVMAEMGFALPGTLVVGADSHSCTYGAFGAFATGVGATDIAEAFAAGRLWFKVPETIKVTVNGKLPYMVTSKDVILALVGMLGADGATYKALEFYGDTISQMSIASRMTVSNMAIEMGAKTGIIPPDKKTFDFLKENGVTIRSEPVYADNNARYVDKISIYVDDLPPQIACPHEVDNVVDIKRVEGTEINQVFLGSCTNGRYEDLSIAADILDGKKVSVRMIVVPASRNVLLKAVDTGIISKLIKSGATVCSPGCGPCLGAHNGVLGEGEVCLSTANRNFRGRMGSGGTIYLGSPTTAAVSALNGEIVDPRSI
jgi:methanogen homoaconitase large subunit